MRIRSLLPGGRPGAVALTVLALLGTVAFAPTPAAAEWTKSRLAAQQRYLACRAKMQQHPPCDQSWTRYCARQCHSRYD